MTFRGTLNHHSADYITDYSKLDQPRSDSRTAETIKQLNNNLPSKVIKLRLKLKLNSFRFTFLIRNTRFTGAISKTCFSLRTSKPNLQKTTRTSLRKANITQSVSTLQTDQFPSSCGPTTFCYDTETMKSFMCC